MTWCLLQSLTNPSASARGTLNGTSDLVVLVILTASEGIIDYPTLIITITKLSWTFVAKLRKTRISPSHLTNAKFVGDHRPFA